VLLLAIIGKSSLIFFNYWLPIAIERPTPVSSLLHSSTIVVARVFLVIKLGFCLSILIFVGLITILFSGNYAFSIMDLKKVVAFSTTSQLRIILLCIGFEMWRLCFLHIIMHAYVKASLFLSSGKPIHSNNDGQDLRKLFLSFTFQNINFWCRWSLCGLFFSSIYFSKEKILIDSISTVNFISLIMFFLGCLLSILYTYKIINRIFYVNFNFVYLSDSYSISKLREFEYRSFLVLFKVVFLTRFILCGFFIDNLGRIIIFCSLLPFFFRIIVKFLRFLNNFFKFNTFFNLIKNNFPKF